MQLLRRFRKTIIAAVTAGCAVGAAFFLGTWPAAERVALPSAASINNDPRPPTEVEETAPNAGGESGREDPAKVATAEDRDHYTVDLARTDPVAALNQALEKSAGRERDELLRHAVSQWADSDPAAATEWAMSVSDAVLRPTLMESIATVWAASDPFAAADFVVTNGKPEPRTIAAVVQQWARHDPHGASEWIEKFPPGTERSAAVAALLESWQPLDAEAAAKWVDANHLLR